MILNGLLFPVISAVLAIIWIVGRVFYATGYSREGPKGRHIGAIVSDVGIISLLLLTLYNGVTIVAKYR